VTPHEFIAKWKPATLTEMQAYQQHFLDLCDLLGEKKPAEVDPTGTWFTFQKGLTTTGGKKGFAAASAAALKKRTLTNLYNKSEAWLKAVHKKLDAVVFAAYGWPAGLSDDELLARLLALNLSRAAATGPASAEPEGDE
jgi:hypothetical protein